MARRPACLPGSSESMRLTYWVTAAVLFGGVVTFFWDMVAMPGRSWSVIAAPLSDEGARLRERLRDDVARIATTEHNIWSPQALEATALYLEATLRDAGYDVRREEYHSSGVAVRNVFVELKGSARAEEIIVVGAHYDSVRGAPGANDNGSGVAAVIELARALRDWAPARTWRFALFVNEEPPFFLTADMGSEVHARSARARGEGIVAMLSLETIGYYSDQPGTQHYPFPFRFFYPDRGDFLAFVSNLDSRELLHRTIEAFRTESQFPSEGIAAPAWIPGVDWSDQRSFWAQGYRAIMVTDTAFYRYPWYHTREDTPDKIDYDKLARVTRALELTLRKLDATL